MHRGNRVFYKMPVSSLLPAVALAVYLGSAYASGTTSVSDVCANISQSISSASAVFYPRERYPLYLLTLLNVYI